MIWLHIRLQESREKKTHNGGMLQLSLFKLFNLNGLINTSIGINQNV